jgi:hypothetical protein
VPANAGREDRDQQGTAAKPTVVTQVPGAKAMPVMLEGIGKDGAGSALTIGFNQKTTDNMNTMLFNASKPVKQAIDDLKKQLATPAADANAPTSGVRNYIPAGAGAGVNPEITEADLAKLEKEGKTNLQIFALATLIKQNRDSLQSLADLSAKMGSMVSNTETANSYLADIDGKAKKQLAK